jgi:hypothetical protein
MVPTFPSSPPALHPCHEKPGRAERNPSLRVKGNATTKRNHGNPVNSPLIFYNPHVDDFLAEPPHFQLLGRKPIKRYQHLLQGCLQRFGKVSIYADARISAFIPEWTGFARWPSWIRQLVTRWELRRWVRINGLEGKIQWVTPQDGPSGAPLFGFSYKAARLSGNLLQRSLKTFPQKLMHLSHYHLSTRKKSECLKKLDGVLLCGDSDLTPNAYFQHFFDWYRDPFVLVPFAVQQRFQVRKPFLEREARAIATGTIHDVSQEKHSEDYRSFFPHSSFHLMRQEIFQRSAELQPYLDCRISLFRGSKESLLQVLLNRSLGTQKSYFKIDLVELYNGYRYVVVGEEAAGFPALGAFEAMACGCLLLANPAYYLGLGLVEGKHFVGHQGTVDSVVEILQQLNAQPERAQELAENGSRWVREHFQQESAFQELLVKLQALREQHPAGGD